MEIQNLSEDVILATLPKEPQISDELKSINETVGNSGDCDVIIDFSRVEMITSSTLSNLLILRKLLNDLGCQLILCNVAVPTKCIFTVAGLDTAFDFADDKFAALAVMNRAD